MIRILAHTRARTQPPRANKRWSKPRANLGGENGVQVGNVRVDVRSRLVHRRQQRQLPLHKFLKRVMGAESGEWEHPLVTVGYALAKTPRRKKRRLIEAVTFHAHTRGHTHTHTPSCRRSAGGGQGSLPPSCREWSRPTPHGWRPAPPPPPRRQRRSRRRSPRRADCAWDARRGVDRHRRARARPGRRSRHRWGRAPAQPLGHGLRASSHPAHQRRPGPVPIQRPLRHASQHHDRVGHHAGRFPKTNK